MPRSQEQLRQEGPSDNKIRGFAQLSRDINEKANALELTPPPALTNEEAVVWLWHAKLQWANALEDQEIGRVRLAEIRREVAQREKKGHPSLDEMREFKRRHREADRLIHEARQFLVQFTQRQEDLKAQQQKLDASQGAGISLPPQRSESHFAEGQEFKPSPRMSERSDAPPTRATTRSQRHTPPTDRNAFFSARRTISADCTQGPESERPHKYHCLRKEADRWGKPRLDLLKNSALPSRNLTEGRY
ncbi:hypothetical protein BJY01DRAFT_217880 [Aspergillus pseudoustus]|uniref:Uncharacterized protein n=1 Tax=Aspergillus pseudoustus TaxID=1810923 RepID=A0ABR4JM96_9EURO